MDPDVQPLVEREAELSMLESALAGVRAGRGTALLLEGEAGIGKSTLLEAAAAAARSAGMRTLTARAAQLEEAVEYGVARQLLLPVLLDAGEDEREHLLSGAAGLAKGALLGEGPDSNGGGPAGPEAGFAIRHGLTWLVSALAEDGPPLALIVDDAHWADAPSLRFLHALSPRLAELPILLLVGARPRASWADATLAAEVGASARVVRPKRFTEAGVAAALAQRLGTDPDAEFAAAAHAETAGTPYLVASLADALRRDGVEPVAGRASAVASMGPAAVGHDVAARVRALAPEAAAVARAIAVLGGRRPVAEVEQLAGVPAGAATRAAPALEASGLVHGWPEPDFEHPLVRSAVLDDLSAPERADLHSRAATLAIARGEPDRAAAHLAETPGVGDPERVAVLHAVGSRALRSGAPEVAKRHLLRALAEPPDDSTRAAVLLDLGSSELALGDPGAPDRLLAASAAIADPDLALGASSMAGYALSFQGRWVEAEERMADAIAEARERGATQANIDLARLERAGVMLTCISTGRESSAQLDEIDREMPADSPVRPVLHVLMALRGASFGSPRSAVFADLELGARAVPPELYSAPMRGVPLIALVLVDAFEQAEQAFAPIIDWGRRSGDLTVVQILSSWQGLTRVRAGRLAAAEESVLVVDEGNASLPAIARTVSAAVRASLALERGDIATARAATQQPLEHDPLIADTNFCDLYLVQRARVLLAEGNAGGAYRIAVDSGVRQTTWGGASPPITQWRIAAARAAHALGRLDEARDLAETEVAESERFGAPRPLGMALRTSAAVAASPAAKEEALRDSLAAYGDDGLGVYRARTHADLGRLLITTGREDEGRDELRTALDLAYSAGADVLADQTRAALVEAGARPRRPQLTGQSALTAAEARTARMAIEVTNREIAETLFVTEKTVEAHLTAAYRKLGVSGRAQLAAALGAVQA